MFHFTAHKGVSHFNLIRLGLASSNSKRMFGPARYGTDYQMLPTPKLEAYHTRIQTKLATLPDGPFLIASEIFGMSVALHMRQGGSFPGMSTHHFSAAQAAVQKSAAVASSSKRTLDDLSDTEASTPVRSKRR